MTDDRAQATEQLSPVETAILAIPDMATALGEIRCLTVFAHPRLLQRLRAGKGDVLDVAAMAVLSIASRLGTDSTTPVADPVPVGSCGCSTASSVSAVIATQNAAAPVRQAPADPGTGQYL